MKEDGIVTEVKNTSCPFFLQRLSSPFYAWYVQAIVSMVAVILPSNKLDGQFTVEQFSIECCKTKSNQLLAD